MKYGQTGLCFVAVLFSKQRRNYDEKRDQREYF